jgi:hypothetical protein
MTTAHLDRYRDRILDLASRHGARDVRVFGSAAQGEIGAGSDLDLLVVLEAERSLLDLIALKQEIEDLIHRPVDVVTEGALSPYIRDQVLSAAVPL